MKSRLFFKLSVIVLIALAPWGIALAHGQPVITVQPNIVAAGGQVTISGSEMEDGEVFTIALEGVTGIIKLGKATAAKTGEGAGFVAAFTIPSNATPGSYTVRAATEDGGATTADLTVTSPSEQASAGPAMVQEPSGEQHVLDRTKPTYQVIGVGIIALISLVLGVWLVRKPG